MGSFEFVLKGNQLTSSQFCRWRSELEQYNFCVKYIKGCENVLADGMSRPSQPVNTSNTKTLRQISEISCDKNIQTIITLIESGRVTEANPKELRTLNQEAKILWARRGELEINSNELYLRKLDRNSRLIVPFRKRHEIVKQYHENHCHIGTQKTLMLLKERFYWPRMEETINYIIGACKQCSLTKNVSPRNKAPLQSTMTGEPNERIAIDLTGPFYTTSNGNRYILGVIDHFSKFCSLIPIKNADAKSVCHALYEHWISLFGAPIEIISDNGTSFKNALKNELCELLGIKEIYSPPYYPQANGLVERLFRTAKTLIKSVVADNHKDWDEVLPTVNMALRNSISRSTSCTPYEVMFGKTARLPLDWQFCKRYVNQEDLLESEYVIRLQRRLHEIEEIVRKNLVSTLKKQADYYNKRNLHKAFNVGDLVLVRQTRKQKDFKKYNFYGPYKVIKKLGEWTYELKNTENEEIMRRSYNQIKCYRKPITFSVENNRRNGKTYADNMIREEEHTITNDMDENIYEEEHEVEHAITTQGINGSMLQDNDNQVTNQNTNNRKRVRTRLQPDRYGFPAKSETRKYLFVID